VPEVQVGLRRLGFTSGTGAPAHLREAHGR
jgi:hypothetical protein